MKRLFLMITAVLLSMHMMNGAEVQEEIFTVNGVSFTMVTVEGGTFIMGDSGSQSLAHEVTLSGFSIGQTEVTQELWLAVMGYNPSEFGSVMPEDLQRPVENVTWEMCQEFIARLNGLTGCEFRLPTEAQWEFAARGGNLSQGYRFAGSDDAGEVAWYNSNSPSITDTGYGTQTVGGKVPNELGLYDMSGNVFEFCQDWFGAYGSEAVTDPTGPETGAKRVARGGSWKSVSNVCSTTSRQRCGVRDAANVYGLRLAL